jgi:DNA ligase-1
VRLIDLADISARVGATSSRLAKISLIAEALRLAGPATVATVVAWLAGEARQGRIGIGYATLREARGVPAAAAPVLTVEEVDAAFDHLLEIKGKGASAERLRQLRSLFERALEAEQDFLTRLLLGELRQGALEGLMADAIAKAAGLPGPDVRRAVMLSGELAAVAQAALAEGAAGLARFRIELFRPLQPMLAQPAEDAADALARLGEAAFEWKLDGARVQVHKAGDEVRVYTRKLNEVTAAVPEVVEVVRALPAREAVLDGETIALRPDGRPEPFQVTMRRFGRRLDIETLRAELPLDVFLFDLIALDGTALIDRPLAERAGALDALVPPAGRIPRLVTGDPEAAAAFVTDAMARGHEGAMAKALDGVYAAGARGGGWLKVKQAHTLDLVVLAAEWGSGRRAGFLSNLHLGARDAANGGFVMLGKTFKGLTDQLLAWQTGAFLEREVGRDRYTVYVRPELVVEIAFNDIQASPHYPGGMALRFARVKRYRSDKEPSDADTIETVRALFVRQSGAHAS